MRRLFNWWTLAALLWTVIVTGLFLATALVSSAKNLATWQQWAVIMSNGFAIQIYLRGMMSLWGKALFSKCLNLRIGKYSNWFTRDKKHFCARCKTNFVFVEPDNIRWVDHTTGQAYMWPLACEKCWHELQVPMRVALAASIQRDPNASYVTRSTSWEALSTAIWAGA